MKRNLYLLLLVCVYATNSASAQNADQLYFNNLTLNYDYQAASFVVDTPPPSYNFKRAFLLWSRNYTPDSSARFLSLDEFDPGGNFISEHGNIQKNVLTQNLVPKKIIKSQFFNGYYLLGYVINSANLINGLPVYSTPVVIKIDDKLNPVWISKLHFSAVSANNNNALIEYNDIIETANSELILAGRFSPFFSGQQTKVLVTRLKNSGSLIWNYDYFNSPVCNAEAFSVSEAKDGNITLTGYIENCANPSFSGTRQLLYMLLNGGGIPLITEALTNGQALSGDKIVRHTDVNGEAFFISGYIDITDAAGVVNRQVLIVDIKESGGFISVNHIGDRGAEVANDLIFKYLGGADYYLYLTGYTTSYNTGAKTDVYYLQLKYSGGALSLAEFSIFPRPSTNYVARTGVEIKKAGKDRFAILENALYTVGIAAVQTRNFTNVLVRDLNDATGSCIKQFQPPVTRYELAIKQLSSDNSNPGFAIYRENYKLLNKVNPTPECGQFFIDAPNAGTAPGNPDEITRKITSTEAATNSNPALMHAYPNPARDKVYIDYAPAANEPVTVKIYSLGMQLLKEQHVSGSSTITVPIGGLANGVYFIRVEGKSGGQSFKIRKE